MQFALTVACIFVVTAASRTIQWHQLSVQCFPACLELVERRTSLLSPEQSALSIPEWPTGQFDTHNQASKEQLPTYPGTLNVLDISLDGDDSLLIRRIDAVPHTKAAPALGHHYITAWHPLDIAAVW